jgi:hypothetical protein
MEGESRTFRCTCTEGERVNQHYGENHSVENTLQTRRFKPDNISKDLQWINPVAATQGRLPLPYPIYPLTNSTYLGVLENDGVRN